MLTTISVILNKTLPPKASYTVNCNAAAWLLLKLNPQQIQPVFNNLVRGRSSIIKWPILQVQEKVFSVIFLLDASFI